VAPTVAGSIPVSHPNFSLGVHGVPDGAGVYLDPRQLLVHTAARSPCLVLIPSQFEILTGEEVSSTAFAIGALTLILMTDLCAGTS
jgi:hypothetical protein